MNSCLIRQPTSTSQFPLCSAGPRFAVATLAVTLSLPRPALLCGPRLGAQKTLVRGRTVRWALTEPKLQQDTVFLSQRSTFFRRLTIVLPERVGKPLAAQREGTVARRQNYPGSGLCRSSWKTQRVLQRKLCCRETRPASVSNTLP
jgi:hypothetical protein